MELLIANITFILASGLAAGWWVRKELRRQKTLAAELSLKVQQFANAQAITQTGSSTYDFSTNQLTWSDELCRLVGIDPSLETPTNRSFIDHVHPDDREKLRAARQGLFSTGQPFRLEHRLVSAKGEIREVVTDGSIRVDNGIRTAVGSCQEITERKKIERERDQLYDELEQRVRDRTTALAAATQQAETLAHGLRDQLTERQRAEGALIKNEAQLRLITDALPAMVCYIDVDLCYRFANKSYYGWLGSEPRGLMGKRVEDLLPPETYAQVLPNFQKVLTGATVSMELRVKRRDSQLRDIHLHYIPDFDTKGVVRGFVVLLHDVTEQRIQQEDRARLQASEQAAIKSAQAKSEFLANMSHEIRTPINGVIGMTSLLADTQLDEVQRSYLDATRRSAATLLTVINDILDLSKIEAGSMTFEAIDFNLATVVSDTLASLSLAAKVKGLELIGPAPGEARAYLKGDPGRLGQVLTNLINNAIKFTGQGSVTLKCSVEQPSSAVVHLRFEIIDTGIGLSASAIERLFKPFSQADSSTSRRYGGSGLGLSICKRLVECMEGTIGVFSKEGAGACFWFTVRLPRGEAPVVSLDNGVSLAPTSITSRFRVLVAEDNQINQMITVKMLEKMGYAADAVASGKEAVDALLNVPYDLVLMDCQMPEMDGYEATAIIRSNPSHPRRHIPIIALTANAMKGDKEKCLAVGMNDYLIKPIDRNALGLVVAHWSRLKAA